MREIVAALAAKAGLSQTEARAFLDLVLDEITERLVKDGKVRLADFGAFEVAKRKARTGRNPRTGEKLTIPASLRQVQARGAAARCAAGRARPARLRRSPH